MIAGRVAISGRGVEVLDLPGNDAPPLMLLHEGLGSARLWRGFPAALAAETGARVVAFSRFGHGDSDPPPHPRTPRFMHKEACEVLPGVLEELRITEPILIGHSDGASIALIHAASHRTRGVVALAPHVFVETMCLAEIRMITDFYATGDLRERMARHHRDPDAAFHGWSDVWLDPAFRHWSIEKLLHSISCPVLLIQGMHDQYGTMAQLDAIERRVRGPVERVHVDSRHMPHFEAPAATLTAISSFVRAQHSAP